VLVDKIRLRRAVRVAQSAGAAALSPLVGLEALPPGNWTVTTAATAPLTRKPWDKRARAAGHLIAICTFTEEGQRVIRFQVRPMVTPADATVVLDSFDRLLHKSHKRVIGHRALSHRRVELSRDTVPGVTALVGYETVLVRGLRGMTLAAVQGADVVSVSAYGRTGTWTWQAITSAAREQLALLGSTPD
jgi:hypothetical protein